MLQTESGKREMGWEKGKKGFTWRDYFVHDVLVAISDAETAAGRGEGYVQELLLRGLQSNGNLRAKLQNQPKKGYARRMVLSGVFPRHRDIILDFITEVTGETRYH